MRKGLPDIWPRLAARDVALSSRWSVAQQRGLQRSLAIGITHTGDSLPVLILLGLLFVFGGPGWQRHAALFLAADVSTFLVVQSLKRLIRRPRPQGEWGAMYRKTDPRSFPSGHSARGGAMAAMGVALGLNVGPWWLAVIVPIWGLLVAYSRVAMGVHYVSDAIVGLLVGLTIAGGIALAVI